VPHSLARRRLASRAAHLNARSPHFGRVPFLALMLDDDRVPDPLSGVRSLPRGTLVVVRSREDARRSRLAHAIVAIARSRGLVVLIANDAQLASRSGADGLHLSEANAHLAAHWRALRPHWFLSAAAHGLRAAGSTKFLDALFLAPVFPTQSHAEATAHTPVRANRIARAFGIPVYALGGVTAENASLLHGFAGVAAIGALLP
jgi:thiamine-phosphate pyrophosphorylase